LRTAGALRLTNLRKRFGETEAVAGISLEIASGEFVTLLGRSGSGKTTTLRIIGGFINADSGSVELDGRRIDRVPPYHRDIGMVFQSYALFPHMTAAENIDFPLRVRRMKRAECRRRVEQVLELVDLQGLGERYPRQLSGGQQQRVALARALVFEPRMLLMDEPLGALDKKLRESLQLEIARIQEELGVTVVYVTHDQEEALVLSDRIAIYRDGRIEQLGRADDLYERPESVFVADFMGDSNILRGKYRAGATGATVELADFVVPVDRESRNGVVHDGERVAVIIRPERVVLRPIAAPPESLGSVVRIEGIALKRIYLGAFTKYEVAAGGQVLVARTPATADAAPCEVGEAVTVEWPVEHSVLLRDEATTAEEELAVSGTPLPATESTHQVSTQVAG
jgi:putative spermidine/putrescine transport system ATP-binding protein